MNIPFLTGTISFSTQQSFLRQGLGLHHQDVHGSSGAAPGGAGQGDVTATVSGPGPWEVTKDPGLGIDVDHI